MRALVAVFAFATIISGGFGLFALNRQNVAVDALGASEQSANEFRSIALTFGAQDALNNNQPDMALALALEATNMEDPPFAAEQMFFNTSSSSWMQQRFLVSDTRIWDAIYHPDGERIITTSWDGRTVLWDIETGAEFQSIHREGRPLHVTIHPDGNLVAVGGIEDGLLQLWNLESNEVTDLFVSEANHMAPTFTLDGSLMITSTHSGRVNIWDLETLDIIRSFWAHDDRLQDIHFNPDETLLITAGSDGFVKIWDFETDELQQSFDLNEITINTSGHVWDAQFLANNDHILIAGSTEVILWNRQSDEIIWLIEILDGVQDIALSPDGQTFIVGLNSGNAQIHDTSTGQSHPNLSGTYSTRSKCGL